MTQMSISEWTDTQNVVYTYNGISFNLLKEGNSDTCYNMCETWIYYAKWNKPDSKRQVLHDFIYMRYLE